MLREIRRYNNVGDVNGISFLLKLIVSDNKIEKASAQNLCALRNNIRLNFPVAITLFKYLEIVDEEEGYLFATEIGKRINQADCPEKEMCRLCFKKNLSDRLLETEAIHYSVNYNEYYIEKYGFSVEAALFRNLLLQYSALRENSGNLVISSEYEDVFADYQKNFKAKMSLDKLKQQLEKQEIQGERAEQFVLKFERMRLKEHPLVEKIKQISVIDVTAGYDILSFENEKSEELNRFIEVKSYIGTPHFYWSQNEIEKARLFEEKYYIYLIDDLRIDDPGYEPVIIQNPAEKIMKSDVWLMNPTSYMVMYAD